MKTLAILQLLKPMTRFFEREMAKLFYFLDGHYTLLAVFVLFIMGAAYFFLIGYLFRFTKWNFWMWKSRALTRTICFGVILVMIKILLGAR